MSMRVEREASQETVAIRVLRHVVPPACVVAMQFFSGYDYGQVSYVIPAVVSISGMFGLWKKAPEDSPLPGFQRDFAKNKAEYQTAFQIVKLALVHMYGANSEASEYIELAANVVLGGELLSSASVSFLEGGS